MLDIPSVSAIVAAAGVLVGVAITVLELRSLGKSRRTDVLWRLFSSFNTKEYLEAWTKVYNLEFKDYSDFTEKYGQPFSGTPVSIAGSMVGNLFEGAGILLHRGLIEFDLVNILPVSMTWEKMKTIAEGARKQYNAPLLYEYFEYLYNETKKREQKPARTH